MTVRFMWLCRLGFWCLDMLDRARAAKQHGVVQVLERRLEVIKTEIARLVQIEAN